MTQINENIDLMNLETKNQRENANSIKRYL